MVQTICYNMAKVYNYRVSQYAIFFFLSGSHDNCNLTATTQFKNVDKLGSV